AHEEDQLEDNISLSEEQYLLGDTDLIDFAAIDESRQIVVVVDNAFLIERLLEDMEGCRVGQDPNHLMRRTSKCIDKDYLKRGFSQTYRQTIFHSNGQLVDQKQMFLEVRELFLSVPSESIVNQKKFRGVFLRTLKHIQRGHLIPPNDNNIHSENGHDRRVLTESPLEGLNTEIRDIMPAKDIGLQVADRVLELNFMLINLRQGEKFGRIPPLNHCNLVSLIERVIYTRGVFPDNDQTDYALHLMAQLASTQRSGNSTTSIAPVISPVKRWSSIFHIPTPKSESVENAVVRPKLQMNDIRKLLPNVRTKTGRGRDSEGYVLEMLNMSLAEIADQMDLNCEERRLLRSVRREQHFQRSTDSTFHDCKLVTTILYNEAVLAAPNDITVHQRSYKAIKKALESMNVTFENESAPKYRPVYPKPREEMSDYERAFASDVYTQLLSHGFTRSSRKQSFRNVWEIACRCTERI
ncbi:hypothetical protein HDU76_010323, partial [Blyttiomyces sp. JEL0837]